MKPRRSKHKRKREAGANASNINLSCHSKEIVPHLEKRYRKNEQSRKKKKKRIKGCSGASAVLDSQSERKKTLRTERNVACEVDSKASLAKARHLALEIPDGKAPSEKLCKSQSIHLKKTSMLKQQPKSSLSKLQQKMCEKLSSAKFRWLNEKLYTAHSSHSLTYFTQHPEHFAEYHEGFRRQVDAWPMNPVRVIIRFLKRFPTWRVGDFGCGDAEIAESLPNTVHSFDLVAGKPSVTACDMRHVPLADGVLDCAIFCLSLMGTNVAEFLREANRVLRLRGTLVIAEVDSRLDVGPQGTQRFISAVEHMGFQLQCNSKSKEKRSKQMFTILWFKKLSSQKDISAFTWSFKLCKYKKR